MTEEQKFDPHPFRLYARIMTGFVVVGTLVYWAGSRDWGEEAPKLPPREDVAIIRCEHLGIEDEDVPVPMEWNDEQTISPIYNELVSDFTTAEWQDAKEKGPIDYRLVLIGENGKELMRVEFGGPVIYVDGKEGHGVSETIKTLIISELFLGEGSPVIEY
jgi:hypothetical protein